MLNGGQLLKKDSTEERIQRLILNNEVNLVETEFFIFNLFVYSTVKILIKFLNCNNEISTLIPLYFMDVTRSH